MVKSRGAGGLPATASPASGALGRSRRAGSVEADRNAVRACDAAL
jgi:hypothetical protein